MSSPRSYIGTEPSSVKIDNRDREIDKRRRDGRSVSG